MKSWKVKIVYVTGEIREVNAQGKTGAAAIARVLGWKDFREDETPINVVRVVQNNRPDKPDGVFPDPWEYVR